jgi:mRNA interferase MazF
MIKHKIVLVPFPFDDLSSEKVRPAVCLTDPIGPHNHIILAFITSHVPGDLLESDLVINDSEVGFATTGLRVPSTLRLHRLTTVTKTLLRRELGVLPPKMQSQVNDRLRKLFCLN